MIQSMTGFGKAEGTYKNKKVSVEIRTLNSKNFDANYRCPQQYRELDPGVRKLSNEKLIRGKIEISLSVDTSSNLNQAYINKELAKKYFEEIKGLAEEIEEPTQDYVAQLIRISDIWIVDESSIDKKEQEFIISLVEEAIKQVVLFRKQEGESIQKDLNDNIEQIDALLQQVDKYEDERIQTIKERIKSNLDEITTDVDSNRFEQELVYYVEKIDINEEKKRLAHHLKYFKDSLNAADDSVGKKLGFIGQEVGREINTLGSKSYNAQLQRIIVTMKDHLEKIKEQLLNTL